MKMQSLVTIVCSAFTAVVAASMIATPEVEAKMFNGWGCGIPPGAMGCFAGQSTCKLGTGEINELGELWCNTESTGATDCCKGGMAS